ncbi:hypothetical protein JCM1841_002426 [Sporobolomyces salmonicolor]
MSTTSPTPRTSTLDLPPSAPRDLVILILLADCPIPAVHSQFGTYHDIFTALIRSSLALAASDAKDGASNGPAANGGVHKLIIESYDAVQEVYPSEERVKQVDAILITGSAASAYEPIPWITRLVSFIAALPALKPTLKIIGICFGHQIIARAFGSSVEKNGRGWEIGTRELELTEKGKEVMGSDTIAIHQMHQDHVPSLPPRFELLGSTPVCPVQGMVHFIDASAPFSLANIAVITFQGHPEFNSTIVNTLIDVREAKGAITKATAEESREYAGQRDDGVKIGRRLLGMLGV